MTFQGAKVRKPLLAVSRVIDKGNMVIFDGNASFILPNSCAGVASVIKAITGVQGRIPLHAKNGVFVLRTSGELYWIRNGNKVCTKSRHDSSKSNTKGEGKDTTDKECFRCGRVGHIFTDDHMSPLLPLALLLWLVTFESLLLFV